LAHVTQWNASHASHSGTHHLCPQMARFTQDEAAHAAAARVGHAGRTAERAAAAAGSPAPVPGMQGECCSLVCAWLAAGAS